MLIRILFVDDEVSRLQQLNRDLQPMARNWDMTFASSGKEALELLSARPFDVVVADMHMPGMDGAQVLMTVSNQYPDMIRYIMADSADMDGVILANSPAHQYLPKPATLESLRGAIERTFALRNLLAGDSLRTIISQIRSLPGLPSIYLRISEELRSRDCSMAKIGQLIEMEPGLSVKVLKLVNSAFYGLRQHIASPAHAATLLGLDEIQSMVLLFNVFEQFDRIQMQVPEFSLEEVQQHSIRVSSFVRAIGRQEGMPRKEVDELSMAGLLHDVGKLILAQNFPQHYNKAIALAKEKKVSLWMAEWSVFGASHAEVGAYLLGLWGIPQSVSEAVAFHHQPRLSHCTGFSAVAALHVGNALSQIEKLEELDAVKGRLDRNFMVQSRIQDKLVPWQQLSPGRQPAPTAQ